MARRKCVVCGSKQWHKEPSSGLVACSEGHILQNYRNETNEADDMNTTHVLRRRRLKTGREKKKARGGADPKLYHGARGRYHYFQCQQLILRRQINELRALWNLPPEFEAICRDLWALHLSLLPTPPSPEPYIHAQELRGEASGSTGNLSAILAQNHRPEASKPDLDPDSSVSTTTKQHDDDPELAAMLRENSTASSSSEDEDEGEGGAGTADNPNAQPRKHRGPGSRRKYEAPSSTVAVLALACWVLRVPAMYLDFIRLIQSYDLTYLDPLRFLPAEMLRHLTKHSVQALSPPFPPTTLTLHSLTSRLAKLAGARYGIHVPEANAAPMLWRVTKYMGGTPVLYSLTKRLSGVLSLPLTAHRSMAPGLEVAKKRDPESHIYDDVPPEVALLAATIVVLKMVYGLDGSARTADADDDPACALPRLDDYLAHLRAMEDEEAGETGELFGAANNRSVAAFDDASVDAYLAFCEKALLGPRDEGTGRLAEFFPLEKREALSAGKPDRRAEARVLHAGKVSHEGNGNRPGEHYPVFSARDVLGTLPQPLGLVVARGARWVGVPEAHVGGVVEKYERRFVRWWQTDRRRSRGGGSAPT
ncbi:uncharacterized protein SCHCODRAFT_01140856 [Schizophyllum commune H4-8]|uniref:RRN7-type domain-containing protein n=1 Tax=Schizophyllum commune (strain H4-8 / FGSC 9210) TaxID=578458 RepID=D8PPY5_SCHCM|nr:uncharacterized protein SCHCODRAFT_01140856 [Schizophyllum commune H4-8]KAI5893499.1 hypothetical protein SCHCODRAFT_01140856 [Schizophyllum commune H4-8]